LTGDWPRQTELNLQSTRQGRSAPAPFLSFLWFLWPSPPAIVGSSPPQPSSARASPRYGAAPCLRNLCIDLMNAVQNMVNDWIVWQSDRW